MTAPVFGIVGWKKSGKTALVESLIAHFTQAGLTISAVKHAHHSFAIDHEGRDSYRFTQAGARRVAVVSRYRWALLHELRAEPEPDFSQVLAHVGNADLILVEGYKWLSIPKLEVRGNLSRDRAPLAPEDPHIVAIASDHPTDSGALPLFALDDIPAIADFIRAHAQPYPG